MVALYQLSCDFLEIQWPLSSYLLSASACGSVRDMAKVCRRTCLFRCGVKLSVDENAPIEIPLGSIAKVFVLLKDHFESITDVREFLVCRVFVPVHFVLHLSLSGRERTASHDVEEVRAVGNRNCQEQRGMYCSW